MNKFSVANKRQQNDQNDSKNGLKRLIFYRNDVILEKKSFRVGASSWLIFHGSFVLEFFHFVFHEFQFSFPVQYYFHFLCSRRLVFLKKIKLIFLIFGLKRRISKWYLLDGALSQSKCGFTDREKNLKSQRDACSMN